MNTKVISALTIAASLFAATAQAEDAVKDKQDRECMFASQPQSWRVLDQQQMVLWGPSQKDAYLVKLFAPVNDLRFTESLAFIDRDHNGMICGDSSDQIAVPNSKTGSWPTIITSMRKLDTTELIALGEKYKMKLVSPQQAKAAAAASK